MATGHINEFQLTDILQSHLEEKVKEQVKNNLIDKMVEEFKQELEKIIEPEIEKFTIGGVETARDMLGLYDQLECKVLWNKND